MADGRIEPARGRRVLAAMIEAVAHRGPDGSGSFVDQDIGVYLGHRRLAVRDPSPGGSQPMTCGCGRVVVTYNGEIYNADALASDLVLRCRRGTSDTEVLVEALCAWGIDRTLERVDGMYAFAAWDRERRQLHLARDPLGIKPLAYGVHGSALLFGSETRAMYPHPSFVDDIDPGAVEQYLRYHYIPAPLSIYRHVTKLPPGSVVTVRFDGGVPLVGPVRTFWSLAEALERPDHRLDDADVVDRLTSLVTDAVRRQLVSDVPVGAFLSGGVDSTLVVGIQQSLSRLPVKTFTISAGDREHDEGPAAREAAALLGTDHTEVRLSDGDVVERVSTMSSLFDEPFAEPSQIAMSLLAERARADVTVVITGDGGDESFGGYGWYDQAARGWRAHQRMGRPLRSMTAAAFDASARAAWSDHLPVEIRDRLLVDAPRAAAMLRSRTPGDFYAALRSECTASVAMVHGIDAPPPSVLTDTATFPHVDDIRELAIFLDTRAFLPQHPLTKVDRTTMAVGLEARPPLLDGRLMEFVAAVRPEVRFRPGENKWLLRQVARRLLPPELVDRPKLGFVMPVADWLRGPLDGWMRDLVEPMAQHHAVLRSGSVRALLDRHADGGDVSRVLWSLATLESWLQSERDRRALGRGVGALRGSDCAHAADHPIG